MRKGARQRALRLPTHGQTAVHQTRGGYRTGRFTRGGNRNGGHRSAAQDEVPTRATLAVSSRRSGRRQVEPGKKLTGKLFIADTRIDDAYRNVRFIEVVVNGKQVFRRDVSDPQAKDWVVFDLTGFAGGGVADDPSSRRRGARCRRPHELGLRRSAYLGGEVGFPLAEPEVQR